MCSTIRTYGDGNVNDNDNDNQYKDEDEDEDDGGDSTDEDCEIIHCQPSNPNANAKNKRFTTHDKNWYAMFQLLLEYKTQHGHTLVPQRCEKNRRLGIWVRQQRSLKSNNRLLSDREMCLQSIGFVWLVVRPIIDGKKWAKMYRLLLQYKQQHGDTLVPEKYYKNHPLGIWVKEQRRLYTKKNLGSYRFKLLESIGFVWRSHRAIAWDRMFKSLLQYKIQHGNTQVPIAYEKDPLLGSWVIHQRRLRSNKKLGVDRNSLLEAIGFV